MSEEWGRYYKENAHHPSNWCAICGLYYCWHEECEKPESAPHTYRHDGRALGHKFAPGKKGDFATLGLYKEEA